MMITLNLIFNIIIIVLQMHILVIIHQINSNIDHEYSEIFLSLDTEILTNEIIYRNNIRKIIKLDKNYYD